MIPGNCGVRRYESFSHVWHFPSDDMVFSAYRWKIAIPTRCAMSYKIYAISNPIFRSSMPQAYFKMRYFICGLMSDVLI